MPEDPYKVLGISENASLAEIKTAHRLLAKKHHPDIGGEDEEKILAINYAWEVLKNKHSNRSVSSSNKNHSNGKDKHLRNEHKSPNKDQEISKWVSFVYRPINILMGEIINPFPDKLKELSADPYDDELMDSFCSYIAKSQKKLKRIKEIYQSLATPNTIKNFSLNLYQCFSEMQDGINEWEIYTAGYVESYLHDGKEMLRKARQQRKLLQKNIRNLTVEN